MHDGAAVDHLLHDLAHAAAGREQVLAGLQRPLLAIDAYARREHQRVRDHAGGGQLVGDGAHAEAPLDDDRRVGRRGPGLVELLEAPIGRPAASPTARTSSSRNRRTSLPINFATGRR